MNRLKEALMTVLLIWVFLSCPCTLSGQPMLKTDGLKDWYFGRRYEIESSSAKGSPYLNDVRLFKGDVYFNHRIHADQSLFYDIEKDILGLLIEPKKGQAAYVVLANSNVEWFKPNESSFQFVNFVDNNPSIQGLSRRYHELIYANNLTLVREYRKEVVLEDGNLGYKQFDELFLSKDGSNFFSVKNRRRLLRTVNPNVSEAVRGYLKKQPGKYEDMRNSELTELMIFLEKDVIN